MKNEIVVMKIREMDSDIVRSVLTEVERAKSKFPVFAANISDAALVVGEEVGEVQEAVLKYFYEGGSYEHITEELIHVAATAFRFIDMLSNIERPERINRDA